ncbi:unnamed protein product [Cuscuta campestris]|uniref:Bet v I/Major latex protein domain-containing protein n=2 Tax=Cuscuta sect. Cleistogrammica TaxID=1824901 RepID=A0A484KUC4_9ASTE|nr:hypothetical protein DM860_005532 [Cuscuta australis]VFQ68178.1 unnamed protein product [Cuscuta campestris]
MAGVLEELKWEGKSTAKCQGPKPHQVWSVLIDDFCDLHRWLPSLDRCHQVDGVKGEVGLVRYVASVDPADSGEEKKVKNWCNERLVSVDHRERCLSYQVLDNNMGIEGYVATLKVFPAADGDGDDAGCRIEWSYVADPIVGMTGEEFFGFIASNLQGMVGTLQKAFPLDP